MSQNQHIIIVDDEAPAREMVGDYLKMHGFAVTLCDGGKSLRGAIETGAPPDLVVLDLNMPEEDGLSIIRDLKRRNNVPVIMLTATASPIDRVVGLELGADDYVAKPCELRELMARIRSVLRRSAPLKTQPNEAAGAKAAKDQLVRFGTKWLDLEAQALRDDEGNEHPLPSSACSRCLPPIRSGCCRASASWSWPTRGTARHSTAPSTCGSCAFAARSNRTRPSPL
jgi:DNA-binding response OmpR family regulator